MEIKHRREGVIHTCFLDYENITDICYSCGSQDHKFDSCILISENVAFKRENVQIIPEIADNIQSLVNKRTTSQEAEWREVRPKRSQCFSTTKKYKNIKKAQ